MVHTMENTTALELKPLHKMLRYVVLNELVCDVLWDFTSSRLRIPDMNPNEFQACASIMAALDHDVLRNLPIRTEEQRVSDLTAQLKKHDQQTVQVLLSMVITRLKQAWMERSSSRAPNMENYHDERIVEEVYLKILSSKARCPAAEDEVSHWGNGGDSPVLESMEQDQFSDEDPNFVNERFSSSAAEEEIRESREQERLHYPSSVEDEELNWRNGEF
ncbi:hypothetical protein MMC29_003301 [Sticta canariensis]|nr:hypothetical protein [Sticta canariensis]